MPDPVLQRLDILSQHVKRNNELIRGNLGSHSFLSGIFTDQFINKAVIITTLFLGIMIIMKFLMETCGYLGAIGFAAALIPIYMVQRAASSALFRF